MTTIAQRVAERAGDGCSWETDHGVRVERLFARSARRVVDESGRGTRYIFDDESEIVVAGGGWDVGFGGCWCWAGCGDHSPDCEHAVLR